MNGERRGGEAETQTQYIVCGNLIVAGDSDRERERERAKVSHFSPVWSIEQTLSSFLVLNGITVPVSLEGGGGGGGGGGGVMHDLTKTEMERIFSCLRYFQKGILLFT